MSSFSIGNFLTGSVTFTDSAVEYINPSAPTEKFVDTETEIITLTVEGANVNVWFDGYAGTNQQIKSSANFTGTVYYIIGKKLPVYTSRRDA